MKISTKMGLTSLELPKILFSSYNGTEVAWPNHNTRSILPAKSLEITLLTYPLSVRTIVTLQDMPVLIHNAVTTEFTQLATEHRISALPIIITGMVAKMIQEFLCRECGKVAFVARKVFIGMISEEMIFECGQIWSCKRVYSK